ncbi:MAG: alpha/beta hydrolase [Bombilactobacillus mellifer]|nr:alpha/beta hydrolase [Bombilactobacillus mellifer]
MKKKLIIIFSILIIGLCMITILGINQYQKNNQYQRKFPESNKRLSISTPLLLVPGSGGTADSYDSMLNYLKNSLSGVDFLKLTVNEHAKVTMEGTLTKKTKHPVIVIAFNDSSDEAVPQQGYWFGIALRYLQKNYKFKKFNYIGHSNGGLVISHYFEEEVQNGDPLGNRLMFLGTPFNGIDLKENTLTSNQKLEHVSSELRTLLNKKDRIPRYLIIKNIYSDLEDKSDGIVPIESVKAGKLVYENVHSYELENLGEKINHVLLVDNATTFQKVNRFFFNK